MRDARARNFNEANEEICMKRNCEYDFATRIFLRINPDGRGWKGTFVYDIERRVPDKCKSISRAATRIPMSPIGDDEAGFGIEYRYLDPARRARLDQLQAANADPACLGERGDVIVQGKRPRRAHELLDE